LREKRLFISLPCWASAQEAIALQWQEINKYVPKAQRKERSFFNRYQKPTVLSKGIHRDHFQYLNLVRKIKFQYS